MILLAGAPIAFHLFMKIIVIANPFSMAAIFLGFVSEWPRELQKQCVKRTILLVFGILLVTVLPGGKLFQMNLNRRV